MATITLPRYIVERNGSMYKIWDTVYHEYTGFEFTPEEFENPKKAASEKNQEINAKNI